MISAVIIAKNEEKQIANAIKSVGWCDEIVVVDDESLDKTGETAEKNNALVFVRKLDNFSSQRNYGLAKTKNDWVIFLDADEVVSGQLKKEILNAIKQNKINGLYVKRKDKFMGKWLNYGETSKVKLLRIGKKSAGQWQGKIHETWQIKAKTKTLINPLLHPRKISLEQMIEKINYYSDIRAQELYENKVKTNFWLVFLYPLVKFGQNYFLRLGFLDGLPGLAMASLMSLHSFLVRAKLYYFYLNEKG